MVFLLAFVRVAWLVEIKRGVRLGTGESLPVGKAGLEAAAAEIVVSTVVVVVDSVVEVEVEEEEDEEVDEEVVEEDEDEPDAGTYNPLRISLTPLISNLAKVS